MHLVKGWGKMKCVVGWFFTDRLTLLFLMQHLAELKVQQNTTEYHWRVRCAYRSRNSSTLRQRTLPKATNQMKQDKHQCKSPKILLNLEGRCLPSVPRVLFDGHAVVVFIVPWTRVKVKTLGSDFPSEPPCFWQHLGAMHVSMHKWMFIQLLWRWRLVKRSDGRRQPAHWFTTGSPTGTTNEESRADGLSDDHFRTACPARLQSEIQPSLWLVQYNQFLKSFYTKRRKIFNLWVAIQRDAVCSALFILHIVEMLIQHSLLFSSLFVSVCFRWSNFFCIFYAILAIYVSKCLAHSGDGRTDFWFL